MHRKSVDLTFDDIYEDEKILASFGATDAYKCSSNNYLKRGKGYYPKIFFNFIQGYIAYSRQLPCIYVAHCGRFEYLVNIVANSFNILTDDCAGYQDLLKKKVLSLASWERKLYIGFINKDISYALNVIDEIKKCFQKNKVRLVILGNDRLFIERAMCIAAHDLNIKVVVVQHGVYLGDDLKKNKIGVYADEFWTWSQYIVDSYIKQMHYAYAKPKLIGYPFPIDYKVTTNEKKVLFIGEYYRRLNVEKAFKFEKIVKDIYNVFNSMGYKFYYRPHPAENINDVKIIYQDLKNIIIDNTSPVIKDIMSAAVVIGDISSVLTEAIMKKKRVIQVVWDENSFRISKLKLYEFTIKIDVSRSENLKKDIIDALSKEIKAYNSYYLYENVHFKKTVINYINEIID